MRATQILCSLYLMTVDVSQMPTSLSLRVARRVRGLMAEFEIHQSVIAGVLDVSQQGISRRLKGQTPFALDELDALAPALHTSVAYLIGATDDRTPTRPGPDGGLVDLRARRYSKPQPSDPNVGGHPRAIPLPTIAGGVGDESPWAA